MARASSVRLPEGNTPVRWLPLSHPCAIAAVPSLPLTCSSILDNTWCPYDHSRHLYECEHMRQERRERVAGLPWFGREVGFFSSTTLFLSLAVPLLCCCALEEVSLREKTSASGSLILFYISNILYHLLISAVDLGTLPSPNGRQPFVLVWFFTEHQFPLLPQRLRLVLGSKCFLELRSASLGKLVLSFLNDKNLRKCASCHWGAIRSYGSFMLINTRKLYISVMTWGFTFVHMVRKDGKNKEVDGNGSIFVLVFTQRY